MRARAALICAALAIAAGISIAGLKIARADMGGTCIYGASATPIAGYPTLPACDSKRNTHVAVSDSAGNTLALGAQWNADANSAVTNSLPVSAAGLAYNGSTWDRLRSVTGINSNFTNKELAAGICDPSGTNSLACAAVSAYGSLDGQSVNTASLMTGSFCLTFNGTTWDRCRSRNGERQITDGGNTSTKATATTCTSVRTSAGILHKVFAAGAETSTLTIYDEGASPTCAAADVVYSKVPPNGTPDALDLPLANGEAYKLSAAPAVNDFITSN